MKLRNLRHYILTLIGAIVLLGNASAVYAIPTLSFSVDGGAAIYCADGDACDMSTTPGVVMMSSTFGGVYTVNVTTGVTKPVLPGSNMDLNNVTITTLAPGAHTLQIMFSETGFTTYGGAGASFGGTLSNLLGLPGSTVSASAYFGTTNTLFDMGNFIGTSGTIPANGAFATNFGGPGPTGGTFSLTQVLFLNTSGAGTLFSGDFSLAVNPEPASIVLLGTVLLFTTAALGRKRRRS